MTQPFNCPSCGAPLDIDGDTDPVVRCPYCKGTVVVPQEIMQMTKGVAAGHPVSLIDADPSEDLKDQAAIWQKIISLAQSGKKIEAIALFRQLTGVSLADAKRSVEAIQVGQALNLSDLISPLPVLNKSAMLDEVARLVEEGNLLDAIRVYRETFDVSLKEAKTAVESIQAGHFEVQRMAVQGAYIRQVQQPVKINMPVAKIVAPLGLGVGCFTTGLIAFILLATIIPIILAMAQRGGPLFNTWSRINPFSYANLALTFGGEGTGAGLFSDARLLAVDPQNGNIVVAERESGRIQIFDPQGKYLSQWNLGEEAAYLDDLDIDRQGNVYILYKGDIHIFDVKSGLQTVLISRIDKSAQRFTSLATNDNGGFMAVADGETLVRFTADRLPELILPDAISSLSRDDESEAKIAIDGLGNYYLLGVDTSAVFKFDPQGKLLNRFGAEGDEKGQFSSPRSILIDNQSRIYVSDSKGIQVFATDGRYLDKIQLNGFILSMDINDQNEIFTISNDEMVSKFILKSR
jgi:ribosomal protein L7/L12